MLATLWLHLDVIYHLFACLSFNRFYVRLNEIIYLGLPYGRPDDCVQWTGHVRYSATAAIPGAQGGAEGRLGTVGAQLEINGATVAARGP